MLKERANKLLRFCDRYVGIPVIFLLGLFKKKRKAPHLNADSHIALLKTAGIGDVVLLTGIIEDLKNAFPQAHITLFTGSSNHEMGELISGISTFKLPLTNPIKAIRLIRQQAFDVWLDFGPWPRLNAVFSYFARSKYSIGFKTQNQYRHYVFDKCVSHTDTIHEIDNFRALIATICTPSNHLPQIFFKRASLVQNRLVFHLYPAGSTRLLREWPEKRWITLIDHLSKKGYEIYFTGTKEQSKRISAILSCCQKKESLHNIAGYFNLKATAELLSSCNLLISVDTGIMHLAAAADVPLICLQGPTSPKRWGGVGRNEIVSLTCCKNYLFCEHRAQKCSMEAISVKSVLAHCDRLLPLHFAHQPVSDGCMYPNIGAKKTLVKL